MKTLKIIKDQDFGLNFQASQTYKERGASRALVFDESKNIALLHITKYNYHKLPGGGIEAGESIIEALKRESLEEIGCNIKNIQELGIVEEYRNKFNLHQISYCFIADVDGTKGIPTPEECELADGFELVWLSLDQAIKILEKEINVEDYEGKFIRIRDITFLKTARSLIK